MVTKTQCLSCINKGDVYPVNLQADMEICFKCEPERWKKEHFEPFYAALEKRSQEVVDRMKAEGADFEGLLKAFQVVVDTELR
jgi:hypothetical protein